MAASPRGANPPGTSLVGGAEATADAHEGSAEQGRWTIFRSASDLRIWWWSEPTNEWFYEDDHAAGRSTYQDPVTYR